MEEAGSGEGQRTHSERRYDVDAIRTIALGLLLVFHSVSSFQPWINDGTGSYVQNNEYLTALWYPMSVLNVWRIPILFVISGMGACFALTRRDPRSFVSDRLRRVGLPLVFGAIFVGPIALYLGSIQNNIEWSYEANTVHLWFLLNILLYALIMSIPGKDILENPDGGVLAAFRSLLAVPGGAALLVLPLVIESNLLSPGDDFVIYGGGHGMALGLVCFVLGFLFAAAGSEFWVAAENSRWPFLVTGALLAITRLQVDFTRGLDTRYAIESMSWIMAILGFGSLYLNHRSRLLSYLSPAVYPAYIAHFPIQFGLAIPLLATSLHPAGKLVILIFATTGLSIGFYEVARRVPYVRLAFGIANGPASKTRVSSDRAAALPVLDG